MIVDILGLGKRGSARPPSHRRNASVDFPLLLNRLAGTSLFLERSDFHSLIRYACRLVRAAGAHDSVSANFHHGGLILLLMRCFHRARQSRGCHGRASRLLRDFLSCATRNVPRLIDGQVRCLIDRLR